jgi:hypothetical protein
VKIALDIRRYRPWLLTLCFAALLGAGQSSILAGSWWLIVVPLWTIAWRDRLWTDPEQAGPFLTISATALFAWLFYVVQSAGLGALDTWEIMVGGRWWQLLTFPMQTTLAGALTASLLALPLRRIVGRRAVAISLLAGLPYAASVGHNTVFVLSRWEEHSLSNTLSLYDMLMPPLLLAEACALLERINPMGPGKRATNHALPSQLLKRLVSGEINAPVMLFAIFGGTLSLLVASICVRNRFLDVLPPSILRPAVFALLFAVPFFLFVVAIAGVNRSLARFRKRSAFAARLGQLVVGVIAIPVVFWSLTVEAPATARAVSDGIRFLPGPPWEVAVEGARLRISGELTSGIGEAAEQAIRSNPNLRVVVLDSLGGNIEEAIHVAQSVKNQHLPTEVGNDCESACTYVFVAGRERTLLPNARLGFHACHSPWWFSKCDDTKYEAHFVVNGIDAEFTRKAMLVAADDMWYPTVAELRAAHVVTSTTRPAEDQESAKSEANTAMTQSSDDAGGAH